VIRQLCVGTGRLGVTNEVLTLSRSGPAEIEFEGHTVHRVPLDLKSPRPAFRLRPSASWRAWRARRM
jgi:rhamnosyl/mannosyltransferase